MSSINSPFPPLHFPPFDYKIKKTGNKYQIFDVFRKKYIVITPEEWVRQHALHFLVEHKNYPQLWTAVEKSIDINGLKRRYDALIFRPDQSVLLLIEFKAPQVPISQATFEQISAYNFKIKAPFLMVSNGINSYFAQINFETKQLSFFKDIPHFSEIKNL